MNFEIPFATSKLTVAQSVTDATDIDDGRLNDYFYVQYNLGIPSHGGVASWKIISDVPIYIQRKVNTRNVCYYTLVCPWEKARTWECFNGLERIRNANRSIVIAGEYITNYADKRPSVLPDDSLFWMSSRVPDGFYYDNTTMYDYYGRGCLRMWWGWAVYSGQSFTTLDGVFPDSTQIQMTCSIYKNNNPDFVNGYTRDGVTYTGITGWRNYIRQYYPDFIPE